ncbi:MAG TPA: hypothetical protein VKB09_05675 [Thermomicrobiales bacterium]|nr:hypothetical protein [Thermomicrobiales bacterium]
MHETDASPKGLMLLFALFVLLVTIVALNVNAFLDVLTFAPR